MAVEFRKIQVGSSWDRKRLAKLWGYKSFHAIARGVITPAAANKIILFVTEEKQEGLTQYEDQLFGRKLRWEGEKKHATDLRIIASQKSNDEIHIFYRRRHHRPFDYLGRGSVISSTVFEDKPSKFVFLLPD